MRKLICFLLIILILFWSASTALAWRVNMSVFYEADGSVIGELWYDEGLVWRFKFQTGEALPVATGQERNTTVVIPVLVDGVFMFKVRR